jgi:CubicO group peptidase (beta-lactamase class C family)
MEAGLNARAIDFAKFGRLFLNDGKWGDKTILSAEWVKESTSPDPQTMKDVQYPKWFSTGLRPLYYGYMWWGYLREDGTYDFYAEGDKGQFLYISPGKRLILVRHGESYGAGDWNELFFHFCSDFQPD